MNAKRMKTLGLQWLLIVLCLGWVAGAVAETQYRFVMVSHMGPNDSNSRWFDLSLAEFEQRFPEVETEYLATCEYSNQRYIQLIEQAIATNPDGLAVAITDAQALEGAIQNAIDKGIPVVAFNTPDPRPVGERIPYETFVGTDLYLDGYHAARHALAKADAGVIPQPSKVLCANPDPGHSGLVARCNGTKDAMAEAGIETDVLATDFDPARATNVLAAYLQRNRDVNVIYAVTRDSGPTVWKVANDLGRSPDVDSEGITLIGVDANPISLSGVQRGHLLSTVSQGFWLQGYEAMSWLYYKKRFGYSPAGDILTGPVMIDADTVDQWITFIRDVFGDEAFDRQVTW